MRGVLLSPASSPTLPPIYDGLDMSVTSNVTSIHFNHDMVSRRIYKLSFYGGHPITPSSCGTGGGRLSLPHFSPDSLVSDAGVTPIQLETRFRGKVTWILCSVGGGL